MGNTDKHWEAWGAREPYFGVLTDVRFRRDNLANTREEFFRSGEEFIAGIFDQFSRTIGYPASHQRALDFGCGVGRLTIPLARRFEHVTGLDVAVSMLQEAKRNCESFGINNVDLLQSDDTLSVVSGQFDFVNSYIVFQHIPVVRGYKIMGRLLSLLKPGGCAMIHASVRRKWIFRQRAVDFIKHRIPLGAQAFNLISGKPLGEPLMQMNEYDIQTVLELFARYCLKDVVVTLEMHGSFLTARFAARMPAH